MKSILKKGFTIVELVIVIAVIAILAGVLIPTFSGVVDKANKSALKQEFTNALKVVLAGNAESGALAPKTRFVVVQGNDVYYCDYNGNKLGTINQVDSSAITTLKTYATNETNETNETYGGCILNPEDPENNDSLKTIAKIFGSATTDTADYNNDIVTVGSSNLTAYTNSDLPKTVFVLVPIAAPIAAPTTPTNDSQS